ncbi:hypothetical protein E3T55_12880 [Cryobacterium frigoriphilum]|uniref:YdhG-like domain-containing protein n=1 Tax=Cryobacterium frigoriphilum TaxID=1259150 RepID=A0A4R8ZYJ0_9MICO|nr:DUF1801 domain-containing protein [Cryobacterium frigoriphilum]TFD48931.1 hypothetical protein E3T55_12880 [Cryobacterium frigoriphilum]
MAEKPPDSVDEYLAAFPAEERAVLEEIRQTIRRAAPTAVESISYGMPTFSVQGHSLLYFAGWKHHVAVYAIPTMSPALEKELVNFRKAKDTLNFPLTRPMPYDLIDRLTRAVIDLRGSTQR